MTTYAIPRKDHSFVFYVSLVSQANRPDFQSNPTLAAGDVKISKDGGASVNLTTLPDVEPDGGMAVRVRLSATEMGADNIVVEFQDAAGAEWDDLFVSIQTAVIHESPHWDGHEWV
jgi:hypothetical protein